MPTNLSKQQGIIIVAAVVLALIIGVLFYLNLRPKPNTGPAVSLNVWGFEPAASFSGLTASYPYAKVQYTQVDPSNYSDRLLNALAAGTGPDVFEIDNRSLPKWRPVLAPLAIASSSPAAFGPAQIAQLYPDVVAADWTAGGQVYGLPLSVDTLVMAYNKDLMNAAGIALPPATWNDFDADVAKLRSVNAAGQLTQAAAAIGGTEATTPNATDLLALLMLQNGTAMTDASATRATFAEGPTGANPGLAAFNFYLQFANVGSPSYAWSESMGPGLDSFAAGKTAIIFVYQSDLAALKAKAPFLNYALAAMPQAKGATIPVNYPKYYGFVAAKAGNQSAAWNFILYEAAQDGAKSYLAAAGEPPALRTDIAAAMAQSDPSSLFAAQALTAKSWYEPDSAQVDAIFNAAIGNVLNGAEDPARALNEAQSAVNQLMR